MTRNSLMLPVLALAVAGAATLMTPAQADEITVRRYSRDYHRSEFAYASRHQSLPAVFLGNPFAISDQAFQAALAPALRNSMRQGRLDFTAVTGDRPPSGYFVVVAVDPPSGVRLDGVCAAPTSLGTDRRSGELRLLALLCRGRTPLAQVQGTMAPPDGPADPAFIDLARRVVRGLAPRWAFQWPHQGRRGD
ncbi:MAG: hypothetical protein ACE5JZ_13245 [Kiloniellales bacterium]